MSTVTTTSSRSLDERRQAFKHQAEHAADTAPERSLAQRMDALKRANRIRTRRAELKRDLKARRVSIRDVILDPPEWLETAKILAILLATPKYGRVKASKLLQVVMVSPSKTIGGLSQRQRLELASLVRDDGPVPTIPTRHDLARAA
jgi:hypothetical protein